jgi:hypothetical protein
MRREAPDWLAYAKTLTVFVPTDSPRRFLAFACVPTIKRKG